MTSADGDRNPAARGPPAANRLPWPSTAVVVPADATTVQEVTAEVFGDRAVKRTPDAKRPIGIDPVVWRTFGPSVRKQYIQEHATKYATPCIARTVEGGVFSAPAHAAASKDMLPIPPVDCGNTSDGEEMREHQCTVPAMPTVSTPWEHRPHIGATLPFNAMVAKVLNKKESSRQPKGKGCSRGRTQQAAKNGPLGRIPGH